MSTDRPKRFQRNDWLILGLTSVKTDPQLRLTVELLCNLANKTKGSFYYHFENIDAYFAALAEYWYEHFTLELIRQSESRPTPKDRLDLLNTLAVQLDPHIEQGMRMLSAREASVRDICAKVDDKRLEYLAKLYHSTGTYSLEDAKSLAIFEYAAMVGYQQIKPNATPKETAAMYQLFLKLTGRI